MKYLLIIALICFVFGCQDGENDSNQFKITKFNFCKNILTDSLEITSTVVGEWRWTERYCPCCVGVKPEKADKTVIAKFRSDATYMIIENEVSIASGSWKLLPHLYGYSVSPDGLYFSSYLSGSILICGNQMLADNSPMDGCQHLFVKME